MAVSLSGRRALIIGGTSGIGLACAKSLRERGAAVVVASRRGICDCLPAVAMDVTNPASVAMGVAEALAKLGGLDLLMYCAGYGLCGAVEDTALDEADAMMQANAHGFLAVCQCALPHLRAAGRGWVCVIGSAGGAIPLPFQSHYSASKAALAAYCQSLAMELHPFGVAVTLVEPGDLSTGFTAARRASCPPESPYAPACQKAVDIMTADELGGPTPDKLAAKLTKLVARKRPPVRVIWPAKYRLMVVLFALLPRRWGLALVAKTYK